MTPIERLRRLADLMKRPEFDPSPPGYRSAAKVIEKCCDELDQPQDAAGSGKGSEEGKNPKNES